MTRDQLLNDRVGVVAIGRNEGERLRRCLESLASQELAVVYVDSQSSDGSPQLARELGVHVVDLDLSRQFTAARARNEGFAALMSLRPKLEFVFFVDGDCEVVAGFIQHAVNLMDSRRDLAVVCGRRLERYPDATIYNRLADMEWNTGIGEADACGGDALMRTRLFKEEKGYAAGLISGEEPELCLRLRRRGFKVFRADLQMTIHDAAMTRLGQWWNRALRTGHAALERIVMHGRSENPVHFKRARSAVFWTIGLPAFVLALAIVRPFGLSPATTALLYPLGYLALAARVLRYRLKCGDKASSAMLYAVFCVLGKFPELVGMWNCAWQRARGVESTWIEYKDVVPLESTPEQELPTRRSA